MLDEKFKISQDDQRRLIIDLLIRVTTENELIMQNLKLVLGHLNPATLQAFQSTWATLYTERNLALRETIFANYGHIGLDDILGKNGF